MTTLADAKLPTGPFLGVLKCIEPEVVSSPKPRSLNYFCPDWHNFPIEDTFMLAEYLMNGDPIVCPEAGPLDYTDLFLDRLGAKAVNLINIDFFDYGGATGDRTLAVLLDNTWYLAFQVEMHNQQGYMYTIDDKVTADTLINLQRKIESIGIVA